MTTDEMQAAVELARAIDAFDPAEAANVCDVQNEPPYCLNCNGQYHITEYGYDPTPLDEGCAHEVVTQFARALLTAHAENERMRGENERMRPVYEAAFRWYRCAKDDAGLTGACGRHHRPLYEALAAIDAAQGKEASKP